MAVDSFADENVGVMRCFDDGVPPNRHDAHLVVRGKNYNRRTSPSIAYVTLLAMMEKLCILRRAALSSSGDVASSVIVVALSFFCSPECFATELLFFVTQCNRSLKNAGRVRFDSPLRGPLARFAPAPVDAVKAAIVGRSS
jgi:hypothetical protein